jgi:hypothetical protein
MEEKAMNNARMDGRQLVGKYGMTAEGIGRLAHLDAEGRIATTLAAAGLQLRDSRVRVPGQSVGIGDVVIPVHGSFAGLPLLVRGFGGREMRMSQVPGFGVGPTGRVAYLVVEPMYLEGFSTGIRIELPLSDRK